MLFFQKTTLVLIFQYLKVLILSWLRFVPFQWLNSSSYQELKRQRRNEVTGKHLLIAIKGKEIKSQDKELIKEIILKFFDLNIKSIILTSKDVETSIQIWEELSGNQDGTEELNESINLTSEGVLVIPRRRERIKLFCQPIDLFEEKDEKFAENVRKVNKRITINYIITIGADDSLNNVTKCIKNILSKHVTLAQVIQDFKLFLDSVNLVENTDVINQIEVIKLFIGTPVKLNLSAIPRLPLNFYQSGSFKLFLTNWINLIVNILSQIDSSSAADVVLNEILGHGHKSQVIKSFYGHRLEETKEINKTE